MDVTEEVRIANRAEVARRRQELRDEWEDSVKQDWGSLALWQQLHCTNRMLLERWWPGTRSKDEDDPPKMEGKQQWK